MDKANKAYKDYQKGMKYKDIADKYHVSLNTVKSWKRRQWADIEKGVQPKSKKCAHKSTQRSEESATTEIEVSQDEIEALANDGLTEKQRLFCLYYVKYRNKVKAYQKAFNCSYVNACGHAATLFKKVAIQRTITQLLNEMRNEVKLEAQDIILKKMQIAFADITDYVSFGVREYKDSGMQYSYVEFKESSDDVDGTVIKEVKQGRDGISLKLYDGQKELDWLYDHLIIDDEKRERIKLLKAQRNKLETEANVDDGSDELQTKMDAISGIVEQMQPLSDDDV